MLAVEKTGGLLALSHKAAVSGGPLVGFPQPAIVSLAAAEARQKTLVLRCHHKTWMESLNLEKPNGYVTEKSPKDSFAQFFALVLQSSKS